MMRLDLKILKIEDFHMLISLEIYNCQTLILRNYVGNRLEMDFDCQMRPGF